MGKDERNIYTIELQNECGEVVIADEVVAVIAGLATMEVEGVASMAGNATRELISKIGIKSLSKGVNVDILEGVVTATITMTLKYGFNIKEVAGKVSKMTRLVAWL